jgi:hypothetical protein
VDVAGVVFFAAVVILTRRIVGFERIKIVRVDGPPVPKTEGAGGIAEGESVGTFRLLGFQKQRLKQTH